MNSVAPHILSQPNTFLAKSVELETFYGRMAVTNQKRLLNDSEILHVQANEAQHTKGMERPSNVIHFYQDQPYQLKERPAAGNSNTFL